MRAEKGRAVAKAENPRSVVFSEESTFASREGRSTGTIKPSEPGTCNARVRRKSTGGSAADAPPEDFGPFMSQLYDGVRDDLAEIVTSTSSLIAGGVRIALKPLEALALATESVFNPDFGMSTSRTRAAEASGAPAPANSPPTKTATAAVSPLHRYRRRRNRLGAVRLEQSPPRCRSAASPASLAAAAAAGGAGVLRATEGRATPLAVQADADANRTLEVPPAMCAAGKANARMRLGSHVDTARLRRSKRTAASVMCVFRCRGEAFLVVGVNRMILVAPDPTKDLPDRGSVVWTASFTELESCAAAVSSGGSEAAEVLSGIVELRSRGCEERLLELERCEESAELVELIQRRTSQKTACVAAEQDKGAAGCKGDATVDAGNGGPPEREVPEPENQCRLQDERDFRASEVQRELSAVAARNAAAASDQANVVVLQLDSPIGCAGDAPEHSVSTRGPEEREPSRLEVEAAEIGQQYETGPTDGSDKRTNALLSAGSLEPGSSSEPGTSADSGDRPSSQTQPEDCGSSEDAAAPEVAVEAALMPPPPPRLPLPLPPPLPSPLPQSLPLQGQQASDWRADDAVTAPYAKMLRMGLCRGAVEQAMLIKGLPPITIAAFFGDVPPAGPTPPPPPPPPPPLPLPGTSGPGALAVFLAQRKSRQPQPAAGSDSASGGLSAERRPALLNLHWDKLPENKVGSGTVWAAAASAPLAGASDAGPVDAASAQLERLFGKRAMSLDASASGSALKNAAKSECSSSEGGDCGFPISVSGGGSGGSAPNSSSGRNRKRKVSLLDVGRSNNVSITLRALRSVGGSELLAKALEFWDPDGILSAEQLMCLAGGCLPTEAEVRVVMAYNGPAEELGEAERFFRAIAATSLSSPTRRVAALLLCQQFDSRASHLKAAFAVAAAAAAQARGSQRLRTLLGRVLAIGNRLNAGTHKGNAGGFRLASLLKLTHTRSVQDNRTTVLDFLVSTLREEAAAAADDEREATSGASGGGGGRVPEKAKVRVEALDLEAEMPDVRGAARVRLADLQADLRQLKKAVAEAASDVAGFAGCAAAAEKATLAASAAAGQPEVGPLPPADASAAVQAGSSSGGGGSVGGGDGSSSSGLCRMQAFLTTANAAVENVEHAAECVDVAAGDLSAYFGEDDGSKGFSHLLETLVAFLEQLKSAKLAQSVV